MEDNKIYVNISDIDSLKGFYGKTREEMSLLILNNQDMLSSCPDYCELEQFFKNILK